MPLSDNDIAILEALGSDKAEDIEAAFQWLALTDDKAALIEAMRTAAATTNVDQHTAEAKLRFVQLALARGADPNCPCEVYGLRPETATKEMTTLSIVSTKAKYFSPRVIDLLIKRGARVDCTQSKITNSTYHRTEICRYSPLACAILYAPRFKTQHVAVAHALLRGGAIGTGASAGRGSGTTTRVRSVPERGSRACRVPGFTTSSSTRRCAEVRDPSKSSKNVSGN